MLQYAMSDISSHYVQWQELKQCHSKVLTKMWEHRWTANDLFQVNSCWMLLDSCFMAQSLETYRASYNSSVGHRWPRPQTSPARTGSPSSPHETKRIRLPWSPLALSGGSVPKGIWWWSNSALSIRWMHGPIEDLFGKPAAICANTSESLLVKKPKKHCIFFHVSVPD